MSSDIQISVIEKIKKHLDVEYDISLTELYNLLYKTRTNSHPDKFFTKDNKQKANEKFIELSNLLKELSVFIENSKIEKKGNDLIIYEQSLENIADRNHILNLEEYILKLENNITENTETINHLNITISNLNSELANIREEKLEELNKELERKYKPKNSSFFYLGISSLLILIVNVISQITSIKEQVAKFIPFGIEYLNLVLFIILIGIISQLLLNRHRYNKTQNVSEKLRTNKILNDFFENYTEIESDPYLRFNHRSKDKFFTESKVEFYIENNFYKKEIISFRKMNWLKLDNLFKNKNQVKDINYLKLVFIHNLLEKNLIKIGDAYELDRKFKIK